PVSRRALWAGLLSVLLVGAAPLVRASTPTGPASATVETEPVASDSDAADDIAIWRHPGDPALSLVVGTDKRAGAVEVYDMNGQRLQRIAEGRANGVDIRGGFPFEGGRIDLVVVGGGDEPRFYRVDPDARRLVRLPIGQNGSDVFPNGVCLYHSAVSGRFYLFGIDLSSVVEQSEIVESGGRVDVRPARAPFDAGGDAEACVADDQLGDFYVNEADVALWKYGAEPGAGGSRRAVDTTGSGGHLVADVEGLALVSLAGGSGYLLASSQGDDSYTVYRREGDNPFVRKFTVERSSEADGCTNTDGIETLAADLGPGFRQGMFVCQDHHNDSPAAGNQNFKYVPLERVVDLDAAEPTTTTTRPPTTTTTRPPTTTTTKPPATTTSSTTTTTTAPTTSTTTATTSTTVTTVAAAPTSTTATTATTRPSPPVVPSSVTTRSGYWMAGADGKVFAFGDATHTGDMSKSLPTGVKAVDLEPNPAGDGYWMVDERGTVAAFGWARHSGNLLRSTLGSGETVVSLSATPTGRGYWIFTSRGRVTAFGDARHFGDLASVRLNGPVLDSITTPSGRGYYMVASDGGIFSFGDARFYGSLGAIRLNQPVQSLVPDPDGAGYWLVASDGGVFTFEANFQGSLGSTRLNKPVTGMVPFGNGYLMVGEDGGIFNFSDKPFHGSLGNNPPADPIVSVAALG
ncbi:MAG: phytase, partial [Acidimicrobiia bacterium]